MIAGSENQQLNLDISSMSTVVGSNCFSAGPIPFSMRSPTEIFIPYLFHTCVSRIILEIEVSFEM